jgi:predicted transcriptional regulator
MSPVKEEMIRVIEDQPEDSTFEEIFRELAFARMVDRGLADSEAGRLITHEELGQKIQSWPK